MTRAWRVAMLLFCSGLCALVYQTVWLRQFRLVFGASTYATAAVLAIFMAGLGVGSARLGKTADRRDVPLAFYARLELLIAASAALSIPLLWIVTRVYFAAGGSTRLGVGGASIIRLILAALILGVPTFLMGGTLPAAARAIETSADPRRRGVALLYGANTLGAVTGTLLATFAMLEIFGNRLTLLIAALLNALVAIVAAAEARRQRAEPTADVLTNLRSDTQPLTLPSRVVLGVAAVVGFAFLLMELVWYRMLSPILGGTTFTFGLILAIALFGIGLGGALYSFWNRASVGALALTIAAEAAAMAVPFALGDRLAIVANLTRSFGAIGFAGNVLAWSLIAGVVVLPAAIISGFQFPLLIASLGRGRDDVGRDVGTAYAWNTAGAIVGSLAGGFGLIPLLGAVGTWRFVVVLLLVTSVGVAYHAFVRREIIATAGFVVMAMIGGAAILSTGPTAAWRHSGIGAGRAPQWKSINEMRDWIRRYRQRTYWDADGRESSISLVAMNDVALVVNGKSDGTARGDAGTQLMGGLVGAILHPHPRSAFVVGLGTGTTAGWLARVPSIERVDVVELEPEVVRAATEFAAVNADALRNPKVHTVIADGRELLLTSSRTYDIVFSEPSNPYRAGIASLFTEEFYRAAARRLTPNGMFLQWVQAYDIGAPTLRTIYATLRTTFGHVDTYVTRGGDLLLVASRQPIVYDIGQLRQRLNQEPYRTGAHVAWRIESAEGFLARFIGNEKVAAFLAADAESNNTDDRTVIEFGFARELGTRGAISRDVQDLAQKTGNARPLRVRGSVDWSLVDLQRATMTAVAVPPPQASPSWYAHSHFSASYAGEDLAGAGGRWRLSPWPPLNSGEAAGLGHALAELGDERAVSIAAALRALQPAEADAIEARLEFRRGRHAEATALLEKTFTGVQRDPWPSTPIIESALNTAMDIATASPAFGPRLYETISRPFAARHSDYARLRALVLIGVAIDRCGPKTVAALQLLEPHTPWNEEYLSLRRACYAASGKNDLADIATRDYQTFHANEPEPLR